MKHKEKLKMARKIADGDKSLWWVDKEGNRHKKKGLGVFRGEQWEKRKQDREAKVRNSIVSASWRKKNKYDTKTS